MPSDTFLLDTIKVTIRNLDSADTSLLLALSVNVGWPHRAEDWEFLREVGHGLVVSDDSADGSYAATSSTVVVFSKSAAALDPSGTPGHVRALLTDAVRTVAIGGRVLGTEALPLPDDVKELARDEREWVGQRERAAMRVTLGRARAE